MFGLAVKLTNVGVCRRVPAMVTSFQAAVPSAVVVLSEVAQVGAEPPLVPAVEHCWMLPLGSTTCWPAAVTLLGCHIAGAPIAAHSGAEPTRPITADLTTVIGTGPVEVSIVSIPCRKLAGIFFHLLLMPSGVCRSASSSWSGPLAMRNCRRPR